MTTDLTTLTASELTANYNALTGKNVKPGSYSKAKLIEMIKAHTEEAAPDLTKMDIYGLGTNDDNAKCPHCGINHIHNGWQDHEGLTADGLPGLTTNQYICLACNGEFGPELETTFTLREAAESIGISAKVARSRYRNLFNDHQRTFYVFPRSRWNEVILIISPKRKGQ